MKRAFVLSVAAVVLISGVAFARWDQGHINLKEYTTQSALLDYSLTSGAAKYSSTIDTQHNAGSAAILITEDKAGGAGDVDVSVEYSVDGSNWYTPYMPQLYASATLDTSTGTIHEGGVLAEAIGNNTYWIKYNPEASRFLRYKFDPDADSEISATHIFVNDE